MSNKIKFVSGMCAMLLIIFAASCKNNDAPAQQANALLHTDSSLVVRDSLQAKYKMTIGLTEPIYYLCDKIACYAK